MISKRARRWASQDSYLVRAHFECARDPFDPQTNPGGFVNFGTAENHLMFDAIAPLLREGVEWHEKDTHYDELHGAGYLREAVAGFMSRRAGRRVSPDHLVLATGATAILEMLAFVLCDPGDAILIPAPYYPGFDHDLGLRSEALVVPVALSSPEFRLTVGDIERAYAEQVSRGRRVAAVVLNSPHNPLGSVYDETLVRGVVELASRYAVHVIIDEMYAESLLPRAQHFSGLRVETHWVHVVYGFAKDFGLSGYRVGILHTENPEVLHAARNSAYFHTVSTLTQRVLAGVLASPRLDEYFEKLRARLDSSYRQATGELEKRGIPFVAAQGGILLWIDLRAFLPAASVAGERELCDRILRDCRVNISPGQAFHCSEPGWFRLCFTMPESHRSEGLRRLVEGLIPSSRA